MPQRRIALAEAVRFHGHLGPYLVLGVLAGEVALKKLKCRKYFGLDVKVRGVDKKPKSCLIDGLQLSTGATYGKGNISKAGGRRIKIFISGRGNSSVLNLEFKDRIIKLLEGAKTHKDSQLLARRLYKTRPSAIFNFRLAT
ncbi:MAG: formylmethanofuran dehydrogenase subunit E family protein [Candidatus Omnitrophica bacterium]|nr:formylmethanofuran dehydrogenase subunit E family protein [Candidatus Omnitrophota bacterium]